MQTPTIFIVVLFCLMNSLVIVKSIQCLYQTRSKTHESVVILKRCDADVDHCLIVLTNMSGSSQFDQHNFDCWPWPELKSHCPYSEGTCQILHTTRDDAHKTCCCFGDLCNNHSLEFTPSTVDLSSLNFTLDELSSFGVDSINRLRGPRSNHASYNTFLVIILCLSAVGVLLIIGLLILRLYASPDCAFQRKLQTHLPSTRKIDTSRNNGHSPGVLVSVFRCLRRMHKTDGYAVPGDKLLTVDSSLANDYNSTSLSCNLQPAEQSLLKPVYIRADMDASDLNLLQHVCSQCRLDRWLGRGRFANVWLAHLPRVVRTDVMSNRDQVAVSSQPVRSDQFHRPIPQSCCNGGSTISSIPTEYQRLLENNQDGTVPVPATSIPNPLYPVAVKFFNPTEYNAWSSEVTVYRIVQNSLTRVLPRDTSLRVDLLAGKLSHPNLIAMLGAGVATTANSPNSEAPSKHYHLVVEFAEQGSLRNLLSDGSWIDLNQFFNLGHCICTGINYLHADLSINPCPTTGFRGKPPIAHRDLKPENILIRADGSACLSDFGQAAILDRYGKHSETDDAAFGSNGSGPQSQPIPDLFDVPNAGTLRYMAPELLDGAINFSGVSLLRTDIYSLGLILWELLSAVRQPSDTTEDVSEPVTPKRSHRLPYEKELGTGCNSLGAMRQLISVEKVRPAWKPSWSKFAPFVQLIRTIAECWDPEPEARLTSGCVLERINAMRSTWNKNCP